MRLIFVVKYTQLRLGKICDLLMSVHDNFNMLEQVKIINKIETGFQVFINFCYSLNLPRGEDRLKRTTGKIMKISSN